MLICWLTTDTTTLQSVGLSTSRKRTVWSQQGSLKYLCVPHKTQTSLLWLVGQHIHTTQSKPTTGSQPHMLHTYLFIQYLLTKCQPCARHYCFNYWVWRERRDLVSSHKWFSHTQGRHMTDTQTKNLRIVYGHATLNAPNPVWSWLLSRVGPG